MADTEPQAHPDDERTPEQWAAFNEAESKNNAVRVDDGNPATLEVQNLSHGQKSELREQDNG